MDIEGLCRCGQMQQPTPVHLPTPVQQWYRDGLLRVDTALVDLDWKNFLWMLL